ncbi:MAG: carbohydrate ABC transporter permease [Spirochaetia bacterium]
MKNENKKKTNWLALKEKAAPWILLLPFLFVLIVFFGYASVRVIYFSFMDYDLFNPPQFVGFQNYIDLIGEFLFTKALKNSLTFAVIVTFTQTIFAMLLALAMNQKLKGIRYFRTLYYMPSITSSVVITLIFMWMFQRQGLINFLITQFNAHLFNIGIFILFVAGCLFLLNLLDLAQKRKMTIVDPAYLLISIFVTSLVFILFSRLGLISPRDIEQANIIWFNTRESVPSWLGPFAWPRPLGAIMMLNIWTTIPTFMLLYLAGLQDIPKQLYEAAEVEGANGFQKFFYITVPQLSNITFLVVTMGLIGTLQMFDQVAILGNQAPLESVVTLAYYVYNNAFPSSAIPNIGLASAAAIVLAIITLTVVVIQRLILKEGRD